MSILASKWSLALIAVLVLLVILYLTGKKSVHHEIVIKAPVQDVWQVLMETDKYADWNPVMLPLEGDLAVGNTVNYQFTQDADNVSTIPSTVKNIVPNELLNQAGGLPGVLTFNHEYRLESLDGGTKLIIHEDYRGIGVNFWNPAPVGKAYARLNQAISDRVMSLANQ